MFGGLNSPLGGLAPTNFSPCHRPCLEIIRGPGQTFVLSGTENERTRKIDDESD